MDAGKDREPGASRAIRLDHNNRDKNSEIKGKSNINRGLRFRDNSSRDNRSRDNSSKDNSSKDNLRFGNLRDSSGLKGSILSLGGSNTRKNRNTKSLKENLNEGKQNIDSKRTRTLKALSSIIWEVKLKQFRGHNT